MGHSTSSSLKDPAKRGMSIPQLMYIRDTSKSLRDPTNRGMSIPQLRDIQTQAQRQCVEEGWRDSDGNLIQPEEINLYHMKDKVILPVTEDEKCSYVETIARIPQAANWFVSHWWGEPIEEFIQCLEQHAEDHALDEDTTFYWICAYANNQWNVDLGDTLEESPFYKAMQKADGTVSILDQDGVVFSRMWCGYELYLSLLNKQDYKWCVYTSIGTKAVGLTEGVAPLDGSSYFKYNREKDFPVHLLEDALKIKINNAQASEAEDKEKILQSIGDDIEKLNSVLKGRFAASGLRLVLENRNDSVWMDFLKALEDSKSKVLDFSFSDCEHFNESKREELRQHIDWNCLEKLSLDFSGLNLGDDGVLDIINRWHFDKITDLRLRNNEIGDKGALALGEAIKNNTTLELLRLSYNNIGDEGALALAEGLRNNTTLKRLYFMGNDNIFKETRTKIQAEFGHRIGILNRKYNVLEF